MVALAAAHTVSGGNAAVFLYVYFPYLVNSFSPHSCYGGGGGGGRRDGGRGDISIFE